MRLRLWLLTTIALVPLVVCLATWPFMDANRWSGLGQWAGGIATVWAVVVALYVFMVERHQATEERHDQEVAQARLVTVHLEHPDFRTPKHIPINLVIENHSSLPVFEPTWDGFPTVNGHTFSWGYDDMGRHDPYASYPVLAAGDRIQRPVWFHPEGQPETGGPGNRPVGDPMPLPLVSFTDADGRRWQRAGAKPPRRVLHPPSLPWESQGLTACEA